MKIRVILGCCLATLTIAAVPVADESAPTAQMKSAISKEIGVSLLDGQAARYKWPKKKAGAPIYCGFVNSKNAMGAYAGFQPFMVIGDYNTKGIYSVSASVAGLSLDGTDMQVRAIKMCMDAGYSLTKIPTE